MMSRALTARAVIFGAFVGGSICLADDLFAQGNIRQRAYIMNQQLQAQRSSNQARWNSHTVRMLRIYGTRNYRERPAFVEWRRSRPLRRRLFSWRRW